MNSKVIFAALSVIYLTGCAANHETSRLESATILSASQVEANNAAKRVALQGQGASVWGDWHTSILLFTEAVKTNPTPLNKFNLATAYERAGQNGQALVTYDAVVKEGAGHRVAALPLQNGSAERTRTYDLAAESKVRVAALVERIRTQPTAATGDEEAAPMTPQQAAALDAQENPL